MSRLTRSRMKGRRSAPHYSQLIHAYFESPEYARLSPRAVKALIDLYCQYRGSNNVILRHIQGNASDGLALQ